jgi:putative RecB family exonuclease
VDGAQLGFDLGLDARRLVRVTPARLAAWAACPRRYRLLHLARPPLPRGGAWAHSTLGAVVHLALRALFDLPPERRTPSAAAALVDRNWSSEGFGSAAQAAEQRDRARGWVAAYAEEHADVEVAGVERWVSARTGRIVAEGRVDRVDRRGDELVVVDYKTGREPGDAGAAPALALYAVATERTMRRTCVQVELHHLPSGTVAAHRHTPDSLAEHVRRVEATAGELGAAADALDAGGDADALFPPRTAPHCSTCPVRRHCPEGRAAAPELPAWALLAS